MRREVEMQVQKEQLLTVGKPSKKRCPLAWMGLPSWLCLLPSLGPSRSWPWTSPHSGGVQRWGSAMAAGRCLLFSLSLGPPPSSHLPDPSWPPPLSLPIPSPHCPAVPSSSPASKGPSSSSASRGPWAAHGPLWAVSLLRTRG